MRKNILLYLEIHKGIEEYPACGWWKNGFHTPKNWHEKRKGGTVISLRDCLEDITKGKQIPGQQGTNYLWFIGCIQLISFIIHGQKKKSLEYVIFPEEVTVAINETIDCNTTEKKICCN